MSATRSLTSTPMPAPGNAHFTADEFLTPHEEAVARLKHEIQFYLSRAADPTRVDRALMNSRANAVMRRLREFEAQELDRLAALDDPDYDHDDDTPAPKETA